MKSLPLLKCLVYSRSDFAASISRQVEEYTCRLVEREALNVVPGSLWRGSCIALILIHIKITRTIAANCSFTATLQSGADEVAASAQLHQSEATQPLWRWRRQFTTVSASRLTGRASTGWLTGSLDGQLQCVRLIEEDSQSSIIDWIWMQQWKSLNWKHLHAL